MMSKRQQIIERIKKIDDSEVLNELDRWLDFLGEKSVEAHFSKDEIVTIQGGYEAYMRGDVFNQEEANELFNEWLKERKKWMT